MYDRDDRELLARLQHSDERAFAALLDLHDAALRRAARAYVSTQASADEVVQETWLAVVRGVAAFEGRSSIKTWIFQILINRARTRGAREARMVPVAELPECEGGACPQHALSCKQLTQGLAAAIRLLPARQRTVVVLRDVLGCSSVEVCRALGLGETNQRVLLHRARGRLREILAGAAATPAPAGDRLAC